MKDIRKFYRSVIVSCYKTHPLPPNLRNVVDLKKYPRITFEERDGYIINGRLSDPRHDALIDALRKKFEVQVFIPS